MKEFGIGIVLTLLCMTSSPVIASPTSNEFEACQEIAVATLENCLGENLMTVNEQCWVSSRNKFVACAERVREMHDRDYRRSRMELEGEVVEEPAAE